MQQPQGFIDADKPHYICKLHQSLYGLKQAPLGIKLSAEDFTLLASHNLRQIHHSLYIIVNAVLLIVWFMLMVL
jgi:hypothetical protein